MKPKIQEDNFIEDINNAIKEDRHPDHLLEILRQYKEYKKEFEQTFTDKNPKDAIYKFHVVYLCKKSVWRNIEIRGNQNFDILADAIVVFMGWLNDHMHGFELLGIKTSLDRLGTGSRMEFFAPDMDNDSHPTYKTDEIHVYDLDYKKQTKLRFTFDYGDGHQFDVIFKGTRKLDEKEKPGQFPRLIDQRGVAPEQYPDNLADDFSYGSLKLKK